ncbi:LysR family transcriptional regulator [Pseudomonas aeruginosa]|nr:LysR family transcriptional regulator [Pseudomonas aeruginosa]KAB0735414.1 LysR family transcriptional regulator [Pseudomonas aeruginosa]MBG5782724.1 LysR family transcriptional regulator [Pseudomonas aeruginosa]MBI7379905.1 LysR family transcriptional regulator [Pseudomonas aeruginosa]MBI7511951.1 LysR family transcriptional regulator [Pseudomonas aeruginosa]MBI7522795.1 LysR family transcriptional regulator [Pseudomonas aeruginosa]
MNTDNHGEENSPFRRRRLPSLNALRCFEAAARLENFSRAAEALCLTHGAISRAVRTLEEELGCALFERRGQRVFLSEAGRRLLAGTGPALDLIERTGETLRAEAGPTALVLSCEPTLLMRWLIPRIAGFMQEQPRLSIQLVAGGGPFAFGRGIDLAIRRNDFPWPPGSHAHWLFDEQVGPVCRASDVERHFHLDAGSPGLRAVAPRLHTATRPQAWNTWTRLAGQAPATTEGQRFEHFYLSLQAAGAGLGVAIGPWQLVRDDLAAGLLAAPLGFLADGSSYHLLTPRPLQAGEPATLLLEWLRRSAAA